MNSLPAPQHNTGIDQTMPQQQENNKFWLAVFIAVPILFVITGAVALTTNFTSSTAGSDNPANLGAADYARTFDFRADIEVDGSLLTVVVAADTTIGPENLTLVLQHKTKAGLSHTIRLINSGNHRYRGVLSQEVEYGEWNIALYPEGSSPLWQINDTSVFPSNLLHIAARD